MSSLITAPIKSASLIITRSKQNPTSYFDYQLLMMKRKVRPPWGAILVFPGGVYDQQHDNFLQQRFNFTSKLQTTAIRQTFQQTGLYFTQQPILQTEKLNLLAKVRLEYISKAFKSTNYKMDSRNFIEKIGAIFPPKRKMLPFLRLITIQQLPKRYDATFYLHKLENFKFINFLKYAEHEKYLHQDQKIIKCQNQFQEFRWMNPGQILNDFFKKQLSLAPPQYMMINVMMKFHKYKELEDYLKQSYIQNDTYGNLSLGPNIISLIPNLKVTAEKPFKYAATMIGDYQFPYQRYIRSQPCPELKSQIQQWYQNRSLIQEGKNRFLFNQQKQFFENQYDIQCDMKRYNLRKMMNYKQTIEKIANQTIF